MANEKKIDFNDTHELLSYAYALEREAGERYSELADTMDTHNADDVAELFRKLADIEGKHAQQIKDMLIERGYDMPPMEYLWEMPEGPETTPMDQLHYMMAPYHALVLALHNEQRAADYFSEIAENSSNEQVRVMAQEMAEEECEHVQWVKGWIEKYPEPEEGWDDDLDPPVVQD